MTDYEHDGETEQFRRYMQEKEYDRGCWAGLVLGFVIGAVCVIALVKFGPLFLR